MLKALWKPAPLTRVTLPFPSPLPASRLGLFEDRIFVVALGTYRIHLGGINLPDATF